VSVLPFGDESRANLIGRSVGTRGDRRRHHLELGRILDRPLDGTSVGRPLDGFSVLGRERVGDLDLKRDFVEPVGLWVEHVVLDDGHIVDGEVACATEAEDVNTSARADGRQECDVRLRSGLITASGLGLIGSDDLAEKVSIDALAAREGDSHVHDSRAS